MAKLSDEQNINPQISKSAPRAAPACPLLEDMRSNPAGDWSINDVETLCRQVGLGFKPPRRGSHHKVIGKQGEGILTIPAKKPLKPIYIKLLVRMADAIRNRTGE